MSRVRLTFKNMRYGFLSQFVSLFIKFVSRTIFIHTLGIQYLGVNGLFTNVLGVLSLAELGIGTAMNYSLYKPVAQDDVETIKSLMYFYRKAYRIIALVITVLGFALLPFLDILIKDPGDVGDISVYYLIFLFNTVSTYFVSYKFSLINAKQQNYIFSLVNTITSSITVVVQIVILLVMHSFLWYLLSASIIGLVQKIFIHFYLNRKFPFLTDKDVRIPTKQELAPIKKNIIALFIHKIGDVGVHQTDNIIISAFINVATVGIMSNYNLIISAVTGFVSIIFNSATASFGNLIATESKDKQYQVFLVYRFIAFWLYGFTAIGFYMLLSPFITLWLGDSMTIPDGTLLLIVVNHYLMGHRITINNMKSAGGVFQQDAYVAIVQTVVNLVVSIVLVRRIGLPGIYIGTVVQGLLSTVIKPIIVYRVLFNKSPSLYFISGVKYATVVVIAGLICVLIKPLIVPTVTIGNFLLLAICVAIIPNVVFFLAFRRSQEFGSIVGIVKKWKTR